MKREIGQNFKIAIIGILVVLIGALSCGIYFLIQNPGTKEDKVVLYRCTHQADATYNVSFKPNNLYDTSTLGEGEVYLAPLVDKINTSFNYQFKGDREADLKGDYEIIGVVEGYQGEKDTYKTLWTKRYILQTKTPFSAKNKAFTISKQIPVDFNAYHAFTDSLAKELNISFNSKLTVVMNVHIQVATDQGPLEETLSPGLVIPLNTPYLEISKLQTGEKPGAIQRTEKTKAPVNWKIVFVCGMFLAIVVVGLVYLVFFVSGTASQNPEEKNLLEIFKKHGSRMIALRSGISETGGSQYQVKLIDDLIKLSDETGRPIIYEYQEDISAITRFCIVDQESLYYWNTREDGPYPNQ
jgi:hypothetical protein